MTERSINRIKDLGLLIARIGLGLTFIFVYGYPKLMGGPERWKGLGEAMKNLGISWYPEFWGFMSMSAELLGGALLVLGFLFRPAAFVMAFNMFVAMMSHFAKADPWMRVATPMQLMFVFVGLMLIGPGRYSLSELLSRKRKGTEHKPLMRTYSANGPASP